MPGKVIRSLDDAALEQVREAANIYVDKAARYARSFRRVD